MDDEFSREHHLMRRLRAYYDAHRDALVDIVVPLVEHRHATLSLRVLDWLVTNYAKAKRVTYALPKTADGADAADELRRRHYDLYENYQTQLATHNKRYFDPFRRRMRLLFALPDDGAPPLETTLGQLNFFRWAIDNDVVAYAEAHVGAIEAHMNECARAVAARKRVPAAPEQAAADVSPPPKRAKRGGALPAADVSALYAPLFHFDLDRSDEAEVAFRLMRDRALRDAAPPPPQATGGVRRKRTRKILSPRGTKPRLLHGGAPVVLRFDVP